MKELELVVMFVTTTLIGLITSYFGDNTVLGTIVTVAILATIGFAVWKVCDYLAS